MEIVRQPNEEEMLALVAAVADESLTRDEVRQRKRGQSEEGQPGPSKPYTFKYRPPDQGFSLSLRFDREAVEPRELLSTLEGIVSELRKEIDKEGESNS